MVTALIRYRAVPWVAIILAAAMAQTSPITLVRADSAVSSSWLERMMPAVGRIDFALLPLEFSDTKMSGTYRSSAEAVAEYYNATSYGKLQLRFDFYAPRALPNPISYYDSWRYDRLLEFEQLVISLFDPEVNFAQYRYLAIVYAGISKTKWTGASVLIGHCHEDLLRLGLPLDPKFTTRQGTLELEGMVTPEDEPVTWAHELGHCLRMPDLYSGEAAGKGVPDTFAGPWDLMAGPQGFAQINCELKRLLGWLDRDNYVELPTPPTYKAVPLSPLAYSGGVKCIFYLIDRSRGYAIEYRSRGKFDDVPSSGVIIWRFDLSVATYLGPFRVIDAKPDIPRLYGAAFLSAQKFEDRGNRLYTLVGRPTKLGLTVVVSGNPINSVPVVFGRQPAEIIITIDGLTYSGEQLPRIFNWTLGSTHTLQTNETVQPRIGVRYRFVQWGDGFKDLLHNIIVAEPADYSPVFKIQYELTIISGFGITEGAGWYDAGSTATFSILSILSPDAGFFGMLGGLRVFQGWTGDSSARTATASVKMDGPKEVTAQWSTDSSRPFLLLGAIGAALVAITFLVALRLTVVRRRSRQRASRPQPAVSPA